MDLEKIKAEIAEAAAGYRRDSVLELADQAIEKAAVDSAGVATGGLSGKDRADRAALPAFAPLLPLRLQREMHTADLSPGNRFHYKEFKSFSDRPFVRNAYIAMLGHPPDPQGERHYLEKLRSGMTRAEVLARLRYSGEGRRNGVRLRGLLLPAALAFCYKIPVLGPLLRWQLNLLGMPGQMRRLQLQVSVLEDREAENLARVEERMNAALLAINILQSERRNP